MGSRYAPLALGAAAWVATLPLALPANAQSLSSAIDEVTLNLAIESRNVDADDQRYTINLADCRDLAEDPDDEIEIRWTFDRAPSEGRYTIKVQDDDETCATSSLIEEVSDLCETIEFQQDLPSSDTLTARLTFQEITGLSDASGCENNTSVHDIILIFNTVDNDGTGSTDDTDFDETRVQFRTTRPAAPVNVEATGGESTIVVDWDEVDEADSYDVFYSTDVLTAGTRPEDVVASMDNVTNDEATLDDGIERNQTYYVAVSTLDEQGNGSLLSAVATATTQPVTDFYELYRGLGGAEQGCCATGPGRGSLVWLAAAGAAGLLLLRRRRRAHERAGHGAD